MTKETPFFYFLPLKPKSNRSMCAKTNIDRITKKYSKISFYCAMLWFECGSIESCYVICVFLLWRNLSARGIRLTYCDGFISIGPKFILNNNGDDTRLGQAEKMLIVTFLVHSPVSDESVFVRECCYTTPHRSSANKQFPHSHGNHTLLKRVLRVSVLQHERQIRLTWEILSLASNGYLVSIEYKCNICKHITVLCRHHVDLTDPN